MQSKPSLLFSVHAKNEARWSSLVVTVLAPRLHEREGHDSLISFHWQANASERHVWYGFRAEAHLSGEGLLQRLQQAQKLVAKLMVGERDDEEPLPLMEKLVRLGISRAAYDGRVSRYVPEKAKIDPALCHYLDD